MCRVSHAALDPVRIVETAARLHSRIVERFPHANLGAVAKTLHEVARTHAERSARIHRANWGWRGLSFALIACGLTTISLLLWSARIESRDGFALTDLLQTIEAGLSMLFFLGAGAVYVASLDLRSRRRRCLQALHELRAMAHIVDMHQLTKDPERALVAGPDTPSSPERTLTRFELSRYLDYCSEMLSLMGKIAALYVQDFPDPQAVGAVDDIEDLTTGLSRKIWQKIMILDTAAPLPGKAAP